MTVVRFVRWGAALVTLLVLVKGVAAEPELDLAETRKALTEAGVPTDGPGLLAYLRKQTLTPKEQSQLTAEVRLLGDDSYQEREQASKMLIQSGRKAVPFLRVALKDPDLEIVRRSRRCLHAINRGPAPGMVGLAVRLLGELRPEGAVEALLDFLPCADDESIEEAAFRALLRVGLPDGKAHGVLVTALEDRITIRRAAAAHVVSRTTSDEQRGHVLPLLRDPSLRVRSEAAMGLAYSGEKSAIPVMVALLADVPLTQVAQIEDMLWRIAGDEGPRMVTIGGDAASRENLRAVWESWWRKHGDRVDLKRLKVEAALLGRTLICEYDGRVWEAGRDGKPRWQVSELRGPNDVQLLPGGRLLVAERNGNRVTERDQQGHILWEHAATSSPIGCQRLRNGNTLITTFNELYEITSEQKRVFTHQSPTGFRHAVKQRTGCIVYVTSTGEVVELNKNGKQLRSVKPAAHASGAGYWASVEPAPNGHYLLALGGSNRVIEIDAQGKIVWECSVPSAVYATRLRNGHVLVASFNNRCLVEVDRSGKEISKQELEGRPFTIRRY